MGGQTGQALKPGLAHFSRGMGDTRWQLNLNYPFYKPMNQLGWKAFQRNEQKPQVLPTWIPRAFFLFSLELETVTQRRWVIPISSVCTKHHFAPPVSKLWWLNTHLIIWSVVSHGFWRPGPSPMALDVIPGACWFRWSCSALSLCAACAPCPCLKQSRYPTSSGQMAAKEKRSAGFVIEELMGIIW